MGKKLPVPYQLRADKFEEDKKTIEEKYGKIQGEPKLMGNGNYLVMVWEHDGRG